MIDNDIDKYIAHAERVSYEARTQTEMIYEHYIEEHLKSISYTFGQMPGQKLFLAYANAHLGGGLYEIKHTTVGTEDHPFVNGGYWNAEELYDLLNEAVDMFNEGRSNMDDDNSAINLASAVMQTLSFEWI